MSAVIMNTAADITIATKKLHDMTIDEQKQLYGNQPTLNVYLANLARRVREEVPKGYRLPKSMRQIQ